MCTLACLLVWTDHLPYISNQYIQTFVRPCAAGSSHQARLLAQQCYLQLRLSKGLLPDHSIPVKETRSKDESSGSTHSNLSAALMKKA